MPADEFDPMIERLFAKAPTLSDAATFQAAVESRLHKGSRIRSAVLGIAGAAGAAVAVRQVLAGDLGAIAPGATALAQFDAESAGSAHALQGVIERAGLSGVDFGVLGGAQAFWIAAGALVAVLAIGAVRLSQEI